MEEKLWSLSTGDPDRHRLCTAARAAFHPGSPAHIRDGCTRYPISSLSISSCIRPASAGTRSRDANLLDLVRPRYLTASPMARQRKRILTINELKKLWNAPQGPLWKAARLCLLTAMRRSEPHPPQSATITQNEPPASTPTTDMLRPYIGQTPFNNFNWAGAKDARDGVLASRSCIARGRAPSHTVEGHQSARRTALDDPSQQLLV